MRLANWDEEESDLFFEDQTDKVMRNDTFARMATFFNVFIAVHHAFCIRSHCRLHDRRRLFFGLDLIHTCLPAQLFIGTLYTFVDFIFISFLFIFRLMFRLIAGYVHRQILLLAFYYFTGRSFRLIDACFTRVSDRFCDVTR